MIDFRNEIAKGVQPYTPGEQPVEQGWIKLNTNENPLPPSKITLSILQNEDLANWLRKYPHPHGEPLRSAIAGKFGLKQEDILVTNGSDEALALLCRAVLTTDRKAIYASVTYSLYETLAQLAGSSGIVAPMLKGSEHPYAVDLEALESQPGLMVMLPNPNAQTAEYIDTGRLRKAIKASKKLWLIDEAYNDFVETENPSALSLVDDCDNLVVVRTFSKSYSLAGLRVGYAVSKNSLLMNALYGMKDSYNEDALALHVARAALQDKEQLAKVRTLVFSERKLISSGLKKMGFEVLPTEANFILAKPPIDAEEFYLALKRKKILIRYFKDSKIQEYVRITVGSPTENAAFLKAASEVLDSN